MLPLFQEQYHLCYDAAVTYQQCSEFLPPVAPQPLPTRQRGSSMRGSSSRHGSHSSADSRKKSKNPSPSLSPARSVSQRNTPLRSNSFKESPQGTLELKSTGAGMVEAPQMYGGSDGTSTFGLPSTPVVAGQPAVGHLPSVQVLCDGHNHHAAIAAAGQPYNASSPVSIAGMAGSNTPVLAASVPSSSSGQAHIPGVHTPIQPGPYTPVPQHTSVLPNTPVNGPVNGPAYVAHTPVLSGSPVNGPAYGAPGPQHTPVLSGSPNTPVNGPAYGSHTPILTTSHAPTSVVGAQTPSQHTPASFHNPAFAAHPPVMVGSDAPIPGPPHAPGHYSQSPIPAGLETTPPVFAGSQSSMYTGSQTPGFGSQTLSLFGSQTPPMSHMSLSSNNSQTGAFPPHTNTHYHQLLETHTPNALPDRAVGAESTPL